MGARQTLTVDGNGTWPGIPATTDDHFFPLMDRLGNVTGCRKAANGLPNDSLSAVLEYDAFGQEVRSTGPASDLVPFHFSTKFTDQESGLNYYGYRYYDSGKGRWLNRDPIGEFSEIDLYTCAGNELLGSIDSLGLCTRSGGPKPAGHHILSHSLFKDCPDSSPLCKFVNGAENLLRDDNYTGHGSQAYGGVTEWAYRNAVKNLVNSLLPAVSSCIGASICDLSDEQLRNLIKKIRSEGGDIGNYLKGVEDDIAKTLAEKAEKKVAGNATKKMAKGGMSKALGRLGGFLLGFLINAADAQSQYDDDVKNLGKEAADQERSERMSNIITGQSGADMRRSSDSFFRFLTQ